jgi:hypothetical protein
MARAPSATILAGRPVVKAPSTVGKPGPLHPAAPAPAPAPAPAAAAPAPAPAAAPPNTPSPYDSTYFLDLAAATNKATNQINGLNANIANGQTDLNSTIAQLAKNQTLQQQNAQLAENSRGGFAQGALGHTEGQIAQNTLTTQNADTLKYSQNKAAWNAAIAAIQQGLPITIAGLAAASAARQAALGIEAPPDAAAAAPPVPGAIQGAGRPSVAGRPTVSAGNRVGKPGVVQQQSNRPVRSAGNRVGRPGRFFG